ncbi:MAG: 2-oxo acid dehydrogenase subunit E2 [Actinobacteria bacterium]|nr:2-oxo acid dehydrogenase subunit E2 [Actinomycetota bacterium]
MPTTVTMPQLGETVTEGTILRWAKNVGDPIATDEILVEISTDKVDTEVPSPAQGVVIELLVGEGETVAVGTALAVIGEAGEAPGADGQAPAEAPAAEAPPAEAPPPEAPTPEPAPAPVEEAPKQEAPAEVQTPSREVSAKVEPSPPVASDDAPNRGVLSPVVRKLARDQGIDLGTLTGSTGAEEVSLDRLRVRIGENMLRAKQTAAHVWTSVEVDYERVERVRSAAKESWKKEEGFSLTYLPFIARATIDALKEYPVVNSSFFLEERKSILHRTVNLGIAIDLDQKGLVVATIRNADGLRLVGLARRIRELAEKARAGKLDPDDVSGSTFSITNPGPYGSFMSAPIINVPNVGILSTDTVAKRPAVVTTPEGQDTIAVRHIGYLGLSWDHRAFDGSTAVLFLGRIKQNLETWDWNQELT